MGFDDSGQEMEPSTKSRRRVSVIKDNVCTYCNAKGHLIFHCEKRIQDNDKHRPELCSENYYKR